MRYLPQLTQIPHRAAKRPTNRAKRVECGVFRRSPNAPCLSVLLPSRRKRRNAPHSRRFAILCGSPRAGRAYHRAGERCSCCFGCHVERIALHEPIGQFVAFGKVKTDRSKPSPPTRAVPQKANDGGVPLARMCLNVVVVSACVFVSEVAQLRDDLDFSQFASCNLSRCSFL
jgi:hypothetical protein